ncbi:hypothetical protein GCM10010452_22900 [Crossiella cryophila]
MRNLLVVGTGALGVSMLPFWLNWLRHNYPDVTVRVALTRGATRLVSPQAVAAMTRTPVFFDEWTEEPAPVAPHVELAEWADAIVVQAATVHFLSRLALGLTDTPLLLALQLTAAPVGIAPSLPPGAERSPTIATHLSTLDADPRFELARPTAAHSAATGGPDGETADLPTVLSLLSTRLGVAPQAELDFGTGFQRTRVHPDGDSAFRWLRTAGPQRPEPLTPVPAQVAALLPTDTPAEFATPEFIHSGHSYRASGRSSAADWLFREHPNVPALIGSALHAVGRSLRVLHDSPGAVSATAPGPARLLRWLDGDSELRTRAAAVWGTQRLDTVRYWCSWAARPGTLIHGGVSLASIVPPLTAGRVGLFSGPELATGPAELDLGWLLGELLELREQERLGVLAGVPHDCRRLAEAFLRGYGPDFDAAATCRAAVLRFLTHLHDHAVYVGVNDQLPRYLTLAADLIDEEGKRALG